MNKFICNHTFFYNLKVKIQIINSIYDFVKYLSVSLNSIFGSWES